MTTSRRNLFQWVGGGLFSFSVCPISQVLAFMVESLIRNAEAQTVGSSTPRNLIHLNFEGGLQRWNWDNPMQPRGSADPFIANPMVTTRFNNVDETAGTFETVYESVQIGSYHMPSIWNLNVPTVGGGQAPMHALLPNMLTLRGIHMGIDSHDADNAKLVAPLPGGASITGILADASNTKIPAVTVGDLSLNQNVVTAYNAPQKTGRVNILNTNLGPANYAEALLAPFNQANLTSFRADAYLSERIEKAIAALGTYAQQNAGITDPIFRDRSKAEDMFRSGIAAMGADSFNTHVAKYQGLINRVMNDRGIAGITDKSIRGLQFPFTIPGTDKNILSNVLSDSSYYANQYNLEGHLVGNTDLRTMFDTARMDAMAKNFALAEFLVTNDLSQSITLMNTDMATLDNLGITGSPRVTDLTTVVGTMAQNVDGNTQFTINTGDLHGVTNKSFRADAHETGGVTGLMISSMFYLSLSSCLLELVNQLKGVNKFDQTVIQIASEFERLPRISTRGSEHGWTGNTCSFISGCIDRHIVLGNCYDRSVPWIAEDYPGTWGDAAPVSGIGGTGRSGVLNPGHITSTLATMLRVAPPTTASESLIKMTAGSDKVEVADGIESARNIEQPIT